MQQNIKLLICDVDGVLTDGTFTILPDGNEIKSFHSQDGIGLKSILAAGIEIALISGRSSEAVKQRFSKLGVKHIFQGIEDKIPVFEKLLLNLKLSPHMVAYIGDDLPDASIMQKVACPIAVANAVEEIKDIAKYVTTKEGGHGAVREACNWILNG